MNLLILWVKMWKTFFDGGTFSFSKKVQTMKVTIFCSFYRNFSTKIKGYIYIYIHIYMYIYVLFNYQVFSDQISFLAKKS